MTHSLKPFIFGISGLTIIEVYFSFGWIYLEPTHLASIANNYDLYILLAWLFALAATSAFGWGAVGIARDTTCPKCSQKFMFTRKSRFVTGQGTHRNREVTNYKSNYSCDNCGYEQKNVPEVVETEIPETEASL